MMFLIKIGEIPYFCIFTKIRVKNWWDIVLDKNSSSVEVDVHP